MALDLKHRIDDVGRRVAGAAEKSGRCPQDIAVVAAVKTVPPDIINQAVALGIDIIGDNRVQELCEKYDQIVPVQRHFIGTLQTNKVKYIIEKVSLIQSVGSERLMAEINRQAAKKNRKMDILIEVNIGNEEGKSGCGPNIVKNILKSASVFANINVSGLMAIPPATADTEQSRKYFKQMYALFCDMKSFEASNVKLEILSMGMSHDFELAIEEGATMVRVGTALFGRRS